MGPMAESKEGRDQPDGRDEMNAREMTWSDYVAVLKRRWRPTLVTAAVIALGTIYLAYSLPPVYESTATILIEEQRIPEDFVQTTVNAYAEEILQTIYQRVVSATSVLAMIDKHGLYPDQQGEMSDNDLIRQFRDSTSMAPQNVTTVHSRTGRETIVTFGLEVAFQDADPRKSRDVAQAIAERFVAYNAEIRGEAAKETAVFLDKEATELESKLEAVASRIADFKEKHASNLPEDQMVNLTTWERLKQELTRIEDRLRETRERKALLETELAETPRYRPVMGDSGDPVLGGTDRLAEAQQELIRLLGRYSEDHPEVIALRREIESLSSSPVNRANLAQQIRSDLEVRRAELEAARKAYSEDHPDVIRLRRSVDSLQSQLSELDASARSGGGGPVQANNPVYRQLQTRIATADQEIRDLTRQRSDLRERIADLEQRRIMAPAVERDFRTLQQEREVLLAQYRQLRERESEAALGKALEAGQAAEQLRIIEPARLPSTPIKPNRVSLSFLGIVLAMALSLGLAAILEAADSKVRGQRDIVQALQAPPIGIIPYVEDSGERIRRRTANLTISVLLVAGLVLVIQAMLT
jgi:uncharacterized protein involved in exopolysaccharide biosynthesis